MVSLGWARKHSSIQSASRQQSPRVIYIGTTQFDIDAFVTNSADRMILVNLSSWPRQCKFPPGSPTLYDSKSHFA